MNPWLLPLLALVVFEAFADVVAKEWSVRGGILLLICALLFYVIANSFWLFALKNGIDLGRGAVLFSILSGVLAVFVGTTFYKETVSSYQMVGLFLGLIAVGLLVSGE